MNLHIEQQVSETLRKLAEKLKSDNSLDKLIALYYRHNIRPIIGAEIEFYILGDENIRTLGGYDIKKERGEFQYEIDISPTDAKSAVEKINECFESIKEAAKNRKLDLYLMPKPFDNDYGNALQININFLDQSCQNIFDNKKIINQACDFLCSRMKDSFLIFAPTSECYRRFDKKYMAPINISKGNNNRTTAIRIPEAGEKRIEYRVGAYPADPYLMIYILLDQLKDLIIHNKSAPIYPIIFGNAFDAQYDLEPFPKSLDESFCKLIEK